MSWLRLDDGFSINPKIAALSDEDFRRWVETLLYCARRRSPELTVAVLDRVCGWSDDGIAWLLELELLEEGGGLPGDDAKVSAYLVHDWEVYNGARSDAERKRAQREREYGADYRGRPVGERGGRRGSYAAAPVDNPAAGSEWEAALLSEVETPTRMATSSHDVSRIGHDDVTAAARDENVSIARAGTPTPKRLTTLSPELQRVQGRGSGYVEGLNRYTGCRIVRGDVGISHVWDALGTEPPPAGWPHPRPTRQEVIDALEEARGTS